MGGLTPQHDIEIEGQCYTKTNATCPVPPSSTSSPPAAFSPPYQPPPDNDSANWNVFFVYFSVLSNYKLIAALSPCSWIWPVFYSLPRTLQDSLKGKITAIILQLQHFQKKRITPRNLCWRQCLLVSSCLALRWQLSGPLKKSVRLGPAVTWSTEHLLQKSVNSPAWAPNQFRIHARCRRFVEGAGFKHFIAIMTTWHDKESWLKIQKNSPHADTATIFVDIGMTNFACDGHLGGFKGVLAG